MSRLVVVNYRISDAEERETRRKIAQIRSMLERCARLQQELAKLEPVAGENWGEMLNRYRKLVDANKWNDFVDDYNRLYDELPQVERQLEKELTEAKAKRLRLELTAATLLASAATTSERKSLRHSQKEPVAFMPVSLRRHSQRSSNSFGNASRHRLKSPIQR